jgi:gliding motility-associated-like protein
MCSKDIKERYLSSSFSITVSLIFLATMNMRYVLLLLLTPFLAKAQQEGNFWYFGDLNGLDFSSGVPVAITDGALQTLEGCATYSDENGNLLFYTNGGGRDPILSGQTSGKIWNRNHEVMYDMGNEEGGGFSARQSSLIIPKPGADDIYYLFTMEEGEFNTGGSVPSQPQGRGLSYFEIDMSLNGGLGGVTIANQTVQIPLFEALSGTIHSNGEDYWILAVDNNDDNNRFVVVLVNSAGVQSPVFVDMPTPLAGILKMSPSGSWIYNNGQLFGFDNTTGNISFLNIPVHPDGEEVTTSFSPNSRYLYSIVDNEVIQYDLNATDIPGSANIFATLFGGFGFTTGQMQLGSDGNIYFLDLDLSSYNPPLLSAIYCANTPFPVVVEDVVALPPGSSDYAIFSGLPNFTDHLFANTDESLIVDIGPDTLTICPGDNITLDAGNPGSDYIWSTGESTQTITVNTAGTYSVDVSNDCDAGSDEIVIIVGNEPLSVSINGPALICDDEVVQLSAEGVNIDTYIWSTGDTMPQIQTVFPGQYMVTVTGGCTGTETETASIALQASNSPQINIEGGNGEGLFCIGDTALLEAQGLGFDSLLWSTGETTDQIVVDSGLVTLSAFNTCGTTIDSVVVRYIDCDTMECIVMAPNVFTPNGDNMNDTFGPVSTCEEDALLNYNMKIYDRWGKLVFESSESMNEWDGNYEGKPAVTEAYFYLIQYSSPTGPPSVRQSVKTIKGNVTLVR